MTRNRSGNFLRQMWTAIYVCLIHLMVVVVTHPRIALASHWIAGRKSWEFPWYAVAMMMIVPYIVLGFIGYALYKALRAR